MNRHVEGLGGKVWGGLLEKPIEFVWKKLNTDNDPESFYFICSAGMGKMEGVGPDLSKYKRSIHFIDDPADRANPERFVNPHKQILIWPGLSDPGERVAKGRELLIGGHLWDPSPVKITREDWNPESDVMIAGIKKLNRKTRLKHLCEGNKVHCLGYNWDEHFPVWRHNHRNDFGGDMVTAANAVSRQCAVELIYHTPWVKALMSVRLPNCLKRGSIPAVDLSHDPDRLMLMTPKFRNNLYVDSAEDLKRAADFARNKITVADIQSEYDCQTYRAHADMFRIYEYLQQTK